MVEVVSHDGFSCLNGKLTADQGQLIKQGDPCPLCDLQKEPPLIEYEFTWTSTPEERHNTDQVVRAEELASMYGHVYGTDGGLDLITNKYDSHLIIEVESPQWAKRLTMQLSLLLMRPVMAHPTKPEQISFWDKVKTWLGF